MIIFELSPVIEFFKLPLIFCSHVNRSSPRRGVYSDIFTHTSARVIFGVQILEFR